MLPTCVVRMRRRSGAWSRLPTRIGAPSSRSIAIADRYDSFPVRGFSDGTFSISMRSRPNSPSIAIRCWFRVRPGTAKMLDPRPLGPDARQRQRRDHVDVGGERATASRGRALEDQRLLADRVEVDALLHDPRRAGQAARRLARLHRHRRDRALARALDAVEAGDRRPRGRGCGSRALGEPRPVVETPTSAADGEHHQMLARRRAPRGRSRAGAPGSTPRRRGRTRAMSSSSGRTAGEPAQERSRSRSRTVTPASVTPGIPSSMRLAIAPADHAHARRCRP